MIRNRYIWIFLCLTGSVGIVMVLFALSNDMRQQPGSFLRQFPPHPALEGPAIDLKYNSYYIAGSTRHHVYLGNYTAPLHVLVVNIDKRDTTSIVLLGVDLESRKVWSPRVKVDSPQFYLTDGTVPVIYQGSISDWRAHEINSTLTFFQDFQPLTSQSFVIRALGKPIRENILGKICLTLSKVEMKPGVLKKQVDGIFCTEGSMHYNKSRKELVYLYSYRNEFLIMDTSLAILRIGHTIDTSAHANVRVETIRSTGETKFAIPQFVNNPRSFPAGNLLFANSRLLAKNENPKAIEHATTIDVYRMPAGNYLFSFYVYDYRDTEKMKDFQVRGNKLFVMYDYHLQVWNLREPFFNAENLE